MSLNKWNDSDAEEYTKTFSNVHPDIALRCYTSNLIGRNSDLVMHGGGNTSVKLTITNKVGESVEVIAVKGSGWNLDTIKPPGFPLVDLTHCRKLRNLDALSDEDMVNQLRTHMLDHKSPNPSVETLLHAFLPHKFVDHSHADAILALADQKDDSLVRKVFGKEFGIVPYIMPGFALSKKAYEVYMQDTSVKGLVLMRHGLFTFGSTAKESYDEHIAAVEKAMAYIKTQKPIQLTALPNVKIPQYSLVAPLLRGILYGISGNTWVLTRTDSEEISAFVNSEQAKMWSQRGTMTPDHVIRTKALPLLLNDWPTDVESPSVLAKYLNDKIVEYTNNYHAYFQKHNDISSVKKKELDNLPRVVLMRGIGLVTLGKKVVETHVSRDIYCHTITTIQKAMSVGDYTPCSMSDLWDMEYWTLEQAKLGRAKPRTFEGKVTVVTGAASGIGRHVAESFAKAGSNLFLMDVDNAKLTETKKAIDSLSLKIGVATATVDITSEVDVHKAIQQCAETFGGVDYVINNAGKAIQGERIGEASGLGSSMNINFFGHHYTSKSVVSLLLLQNTGSRQEASTSTTPMGGCLLFNISKAAVNPGYLFGPYAVAKAATLALMKQYAVDYGKDNIRANAVNPDRIRTNLFTPELVSSRAKARGVTEDEYFKCNLLKQEVTVEDVSKAFIAMALSYKTSGCMITVDGGNISAAPR